MRLVAFILSLIVLGLSFVPCNDEAYKLKDTKAKISASATEDSQDQNEICSPFCHCSCCAGFYFVYQIPHVSQPLAVHAKPADSYLPHAILEVSLPVWQPPKIG